MTNHPAGPDVIFIGPDKTGSTWVHELLLCNEDVFVPASKELFFFNHRFKKGVDWYESHFSKAQPNQVRAEVGHDYLTFDEAGARLRSSAPTARLVVGVRDPLSRLVSSYRYMRLQRRATEPLSVAVQSTPELVDHGRYGYWVERLLREHPNADLATYDFHLLELDADAFAHQLLREHLGLNPNRVELPPPANVARSARSPGTIRAGRLVLELTRRAGGHDIAAAMKRRMLESRVLFSPDRYEVTVEDERALEGLRVSYEEDLRLLDELLGTTHCSVISRRWAEGANP